MSGGSENVLQPSQITPEMVRLEAVVPECPSGDDMPQRIKLEITTGNEGDLFGCAGCFSVIAVWALFAGANGCTDKYHRVIMGPSPFVSALGVIFLFACIYYWVNYYFTDEYYILDTVERNIYFYRKHFGKVAVSDFLKQEDIHSIAVTGEKKRSKNSSWWEYKVVAVRTDAKVVDLCDLKADSYQPMYDKALGIATATLRGFAACPLESSLYVVTGKEGKIQLYYGKKTQA
ncbi:MAG TPA: hypothetical protein PKK26_06630 [Candidatus Wallbacteria bacterium]|nr:hypothetical protein [Candidatus Wallbacteria bacterium]